jgi:hypothetical protein
MLVVGDSRDERMFWVLAGRVVMAVRRTWVRL